MPLHKPLMIKSKKFTMKGGDREMKKVLIGVLLVVFALTLTTALTTTVAADSSNAFEPDTGNRVGNHISGEATSPHHDPGFVGNWWSNDHEGNKGTPPAWGQGGVKENLP